MTAILTKSPEPIWLDRVLVVARPKAYVHELIPEGRILHCPKCGGYHVERGEMRCDSCGRCGHPYLQQLPRAWSA
jgi:hypothetical protein